ISVALDNELNREVALKEILADHVGSNETKDRFYREAQITGRLEHPCIVPVYGMGEHTDGSPYYVMRFIRGEELKKAIDGFHNNYPPDRFVGKRRVEFIQLLRQFTSVCNAIGYAHSRGIIHRDIKPANVLLGKFNETFVVDWGLAKPIGEVESTPTEGNINLTSISDPDSSHTQMHSTLGTPGYMSPEQADGRLNELGPASDVYSLGATLYYLLTKKSSVSGSDLLAITEQIRTGSFPSPRSLNKHIPAALDAICLQAMALEPEDRYKTPQQLAADIESWIADEPVSVYPESLTHRFGRWLRQHRSWALASATSLLIIATISILAAISINRAKNEEARQRELADKSKRQAVAARDLAEQRRVEALDNFRQARNAVDTSLTGISEVLKHHPGMQQMRQGLLEKAATDYEQFASQKSDDLEIQLERGRAYLRLGDARRDLDQVPEAENAYKHAAEVFTDLKEAQPGNPDPEREHASSQVKLANLYQL
ncbi:MAG: serine/threonine-protein kinase, partial [Pirellulaceae bacterium]|nr:serine/threonine-protein kinase [Pirellulaceae bacterium]